jgi:hypothetical protein
MEFSDVESCVKDFSDLGAEYKVLEVSVLIILLGQNDAARMFVLSLFNSNLWNWVLKPLFKYFTQLVIILA